MVKKYLGVHFLYFTSIIHHDDEQEDVVKWFTGLKQNG